MQITIKTCAKKAIFIPLMFDKIKTNVSGEMGEAAAGGVDYPVSPHPASEAYPAGESMPGGEGNRRQIK